MYMTYITYNYQDTVYDMTKEEKETMLYYWLLR